MVESSLHNMQQIFHLLVVWTNVCQMANGFVKCSFEFPNIIATNYTIFIAVETATGK